MKARIFVTLKNGVLDPQGQAIQGALGALGFEGVNSVRQGKVFEIELADSDDARSAPEIDVREASRQHRHRGFPGRGRLTRGRSYWVIFVSHPARSPASSRGAATANAWTAACDHSA